MTAPARPTVTLRRWIGFMAMVVGMFMAILDIQIVASSLSEIRAGLSASVDEISWVQTSYLIAEVIMIPLSGFLSHLLSTRGVFVLSAVGFTLSSLLCAMAWDIDSMIVLRALQGFLGGAMIPTVFATSFTIFPPERRALVSVMVGLVATMAPTIGPTLGGYITQIASWHWLFLMNLAPGIIVSVVVWATMDVDHPDWSLLKTFDGRGLVLMALFLGSLEYVMEEGPRNDWLEDFHIATFTVVMAVAGALFFWRVLTTDNPIVDVRAFGDRNFALGSLFSFVLGTGLYGAVYVIPLFLARVRGYNSFDIGTIMAVTGAFQFLSAPIAGALSRKMDLRLMLFIGLAMYAVGLYLHSIITHDSSFWEFFLPQAVRGFSLMFCFLPINSLALGTLPVAQLKNASGLYNLMRNLGGAIGLASINTVIISRLAHHDAHLAERLTPSRPDVQAFLDGLGAKLGALISGDPQLAAVRYLKLMLEREALVLTFADVLIVMAGVFALSLLFMPLVRKPKAAPPPEAHG